MRSGACGSGGESRSYALAESYGSRIFMQPSEHRHGEGHGRLGIPQCRRVPLRVRGVRAAHRRSRTGELATDDNNPDRPRPVII